MNDTTGTLLPTLSPRDAMLASFSDKSYYNPSGQGWQEFQQQAATWGYAPLEIDQQSFKATDPAFSAQAWVNKTTGEVVVAYRGSDELKDFIGADAALGNKPSALSSNDFVLAMGA